MRLFRRKNKTPVTSAELHDAAVAKSAKKRIHVTPPEGVPISFARASLGSRVGAQLLDIAITYGTLIGLLILVFWMSSLNWTAVTTFFALMSFLIRIPYYILTELMWNGRTLGKRIVKIRVVSANGRRLEPHQVVVRNLMKEAEVLTPIGLFFSLSNTSGWGQLITGLWLMLTFAVPVFSRTSQRFGDMIAGTYVIENPRLQKTVELTDRTKYATQTFEFIPRHLDIYGRFELQSLEAILRQPAEPKRDSEIAATIAKKIGYIEKVAPSNSRAFLEAFYNAQRAHLEQRQLFGDRRDNKFYSAEAED